MLHSIRSRKLCLSLLAITSLLAGCAAEGENDAEGEEPLAETAEAVMTRTQCEAVTIDHAPWLKCFKNGTDDTTILHKIETSAKGIYDFTNHAPKDGAPSAFITAKGKNPPADATSFTFTVYGGFKSHDPNAPLMLKNSLNKLPNSHVALFWDLGLNFIVGDQIAGNNKTSGGATMPNNPTNVSWQAFHRDKDIYNLDHSITLLHELGHSFVSARGVRAAVKKTCAAGVLKADCVTTAERTAIAGYVGPSITKVTVNGVKVNTTLDQDLSGCPELSAADQPNCGRAERMCDLYEAHARGKLTAGSTLATVSARLYGPI